MLERGVLLPGSRRLVRRLGLLGLIPLAGFACGRSAQPTGDSVLWAASLVASILLENILFLLPGIAIACLLQSKRPVDSLRFACVALPGSALAGYPAFWAYLLGAGVGKAASVLILVTSLAYVLHVLRARRVAAGLLRGTATCALLMVTVATFYSALGFLYKYSDQAGVQAQTRFLWRLPVDNVLPYWLADKLYHSHPIRPFLAPDWQSSDRPPLQAGLSLLQYPLWGGHREFHYQVLGVLLQSQWVAAVWILLRSLKVDRRSTVMVCAFCVFSSFFLLNSFYVWPKLLAASLFLLAIVLAGFAEGRVRSGRAFDMAAAGAALGLALLSHAGVGFSILALGVVLLVSRQLPPLNKLAWSVLMLAVLLLPWAVYQKVYDPPGNRLLKWHLAGVIERDSRSLPQALLDAYSKAGLSQILSNKLENFAALFGKGFWPEPGQAIKGKIPWRRVLSSYQAATFFYFFPTLGVLNLGWLTILFARVWPKRVPASPLLPQAGRLLLLCCTSLIIWCLLMYWPGGTVVPSGSLADVVIFFVVLGISLAVVAPRLAYVLLAFQACALFPLVVFGNPLQEAGPNQVQVGGPDPGMAATALLSLLVLAVLGWRYGFSFRATAERMEGTAGGEPQSGAAIV